MSATSKTGLLPTLKKKKIDHGIQTTATLELPNLAVQASFSLKPFAGIYNPFPYGCSILCNHPIDFEAKSIVKKAKHAWTSEGKSLLDLDELSALRAEKEIKKDQQLLKSNEEREEKVPEELFRKYTETDSRPITPAPTLASTVTKNLRTRRCMTPDPTAFLPAKEKTLLVLDLRRSHSQETVCWQGHLDEYNFDNELDEEVISRGTSFSSSNPSQTKKKRTPKKKTSSPSVTVSSLKTQDSKDSDSKHQTQYSSVSQSPFKGSVRQEQEISPKNVEISNQDSSNGISITKRRGKKPKKGKKCGKGDKEFQGIPDPGETQVSALENDSKEGSSRQSLAEEGKIVENQPEENLASSELKPKVEESSSSFLNKDTLKQLQKQLDQEVVDSEQNAKIKIALEEALRHKKNPKHVRLGEEMKNLKNEFKLFIKDSEKWLTTPRVFTRRSARFELPMDSRELNSMTPMQYVQKYVFASPERLVLYNHIFNLFKEEPEDDDERERIMLGKNVMEALAKVMGRALSIQEANEFRSLLNWDEDGSLDFRAFAGISATCERVMSPQFCAKMSTQKEDPRHEIEQADFETLNEKLLRLNPNPNLVRILKSIRDL